MSLEARLRERIQRQGPISFYEWMKTALYDEREGYYCANCVRQGRAGDYRTAPETSPLFAATFAGYFTRLFRELGSPPLFTVVEVGAGPGEFARIVLTTLRAEHPEVFNAIDYVIEEVSKAARMRCLAQLAEFSNRVTVSSPIVREGNSGCAQSSASEKITGIIFSNELIDALPVNRVVMRDNRLRQFYVGLDDATFTWIEDDVEPAVAEHCERINLQLREGQTAEINLDAEAFIARAAGLLERGFIISVDYGAERTELLNSPDRFSGTLRAFRRHQFAVDLLKRPGQQDLTTTVDWTQIKEAGKHAGLRTVRLERLDLFLIAEGLLARISDITESVTDAAAALRLTTGARELILPDGMAASFQVLVQEKMSSPATSSSR